MGMETRIGVTERGDAACDLSWYEKCLESVRTGYLKGAVIITKRATDEVMERMSKLHAQGFPVILHATTTGWGGTPLEPGVWDYRTNLENLADWTRHGGFPANRATLRIDPVFPTEKGVERACDVIRYAHGLGLPQNGCRLRMSILDEYTHVKNRFLAAGYAPVYGTSFYPPRDMAGYAAREICRCMDGLQSETPNRALPPIETCAEDLLRSLPVDWRNWFVPMGCVSEKDLETMGLPIPESRRENPQGRKGCHCLCGKTELLTKRHPCPHKCMYCYWRD